MKKYFDVKINVDIKVYEYGLTHSEIYNFIDDLPLSAMNFNEFNTAIIGGILVDLFPYFDIYNNMIINVDLDE